MEPDFGGWATKANLKCSDGRTILPDAFKHMDKQQVPLVWQHGHSNPENVLGYAVLEHRDEGVYAKAYFNETPAGKNSKLQVQHGDIKHLSIYANQLIEKAVNGGKNVIHGMIREVSLVLAGANPGAVIDFVRIQHSDDPDDVTTLTDEAVIKTGEEIVLQHADAPKQDAPPADDGEGVSLQQAYDDLDEDTQGLVAALVEAALEAGAQHSDDGAPKDGEPKEGDPKDGEPADDQNPEGDLNHQEGTGAMTRNVFDQSATGTGSDGKPQKTLSHAEFREIAKKAVKAGSLKAVLDETALEHGVENIEVLFPDAKAISATPEWNKRRTEWVASVLNGVDRRPFSRIKTLVADITQDEARARGYIKGTYKKQEWFSITQRKTGPTTIYKKQQLDRDDIVDITDFDIVAWLWEEMYFMLREELARAILLGDGREPDDPDKINEENIRPIAMDDEFYTDILTVPTNVSPSGLIEAVLRGRNRYKGSAPTAYMTNAVMVDMLLEKDDLGRRYYNSKAELATALNVRDIVEVEVLDGAMRDENEIQMIIVNPGDYTVGSTRGGEITKFSDFDIDVNQEKYLIETRISGALTSPKRAQVVVRTAGALATPTVPTFNATTGVVTIPTVTGVTYKDQQTNATLSAGAQTALDPEESVSIKAVPNSGYYFPHNFDADWTFTRPAA